MSGGFFSGLIGRRRQEAEDASPPPPPSSDDLERQFPRTTPPTGYGSIGNNEHFDGGDDNEEVVAIGGALVPGAEPPDRPSAPTPTEEAQLPAIPPIVNPEDVVNEEVAVQSLTQRLRCLFTVLTLPIIPIGTALSFLLLFVLYAAFVTDLHRQCSAPLHGYAIVSLILFIYAPNHRYIKYHLFHYSRERDGPNRPRSVRVYDQAFQTICILYVYFGMTLIQTCVDDTTTVPIDSGNMGKSSGDGSGAGSAMASAVGLGVQPLATMDSDTAHAMTMSTCEVTCPALYASTKTFVNTLQIFFLVLVMPLLMLPCIYVWVVRRASAVAALAELGRGGHGDFDEDGGGGGRSYTAREILNGMDIVRFISSSPPGAIGNDSSEKVKIVTLAKGVPPRGDVEEGLGLGGGSSGGVTNALTSPMPSYYRDRDDVRECCICMAEFRLDDTELPEELAQLARNRDVMRVSGDFIVRTKCNHFFHFRCIGGWLGGQWTEQGGTVESQRVRRRACPLCREDLAQTSASTRPSSGMSGVDRAVVESTALLEPGNGLM